MSESAVSAVPTSVLKGAVLNLTLSGRSHDPEISVRIDGLPKGELINLDELQAFMERRRSGASGVTTARKEPDVPEFREGVIFNEREHICDEFGCRLAPQTISTTGASLYAVIANRDTRSGDYNNLAGIPRPGHADLGAYLKHGPAYNMAGGGEFSGRMTALLCIAGGIAKQILARRGITVEAQVENLESVLSRAETARANGDTVGGAIVCTATGVPAGLGDAYFGGMEGKLSTAFFGIPSVKGVEFGLGFKVAEMFGSENNDPIALEDGRIVTTTNNCGGILGGITNGMPITARLALKPAPSISIPQQTVDMNTMQPTTIQVKGRHDVCTVVRGVPVVEAVMAFVLLDAILEGER